MPKADDGNTTAASNEATATNVILLADLIKDRIAKHEPAMQSAVPGFNLEGTAPGSMTLADELHLLTNYLGVVAVTMTEKVAKQKALPMDVRAGALIVRCHRKAEWIRKRVAKLERKADKWKERAKAKS